MARHNLLQLLDLNETMDQLAKANSIRWHRHVLRNDKSNFLRMGLNINVKGTWKIGRRRKTWQRAVLEQRRNVGQNEGDANNRSRWRLWVNTTCIKMSYNRPPPLFGDKSG